MELILFLLLFAASILVLVKGADWFIEAAEQIGLTLGISPFIIGVTIVAFGTSLPELATSVAAVYANDSAIVVGNVVGSNITNILLVLGIVSLVRRRLDIGYHIMDVDMPMLIGSAIFFWFVLSDGQFGLFDAILFILGLVIFLFNTLSNKLEPRETRPKLVWKTVLIFVLGGAMVYLGAAYTIFSLEELALGMGVNSELIALSLVALGTSLPEVTVSIAAAKKGNLAIAVGNVLGSNIFNTYAVMSISSFFGELAIPDNILSFALPFMVGVTIIFGFIAITEKLSRWSGGMLLMLYVFFLVQLFQGQSFI